MEEEIHPGNSRRGDVFFLAVEPAEEGPRVAAGLADVLDGGQARRWRQRIPEP